MHYIGSQFLSMKVMFKNSVFLFILFVGVQISCSSSVKKEPVVEAKQEVKTESKKEGISQNKKLPNMNLTRFDGSTFNAQSLLGSKVIFILFQPDCEHCQNEATQIAARLEKFSKYTLYFVSSAPLKDIEKFSISYKLSGWPNINFAKTEVQSIIDSYGPIPAPSIFIYSENGELLNSFEGEMEIDVVLKYL
jgi:peroxiredoxin